MNCTNCNAPLDTQARFCPKCGTPIAQATPTPWNPAPLYQPVSQVEPQTILPTEQTILPSRQRLPLHPQPPQPAQQQIVLPPTPGRQQAGYTPQMNPQAWKSQEKAPDKRRGGSCLLRGLIVLVILLTLIVGGLYFVGRPALSSVAQSKLNSVLAQAVSNIPAQIALLPNGKVKIPEGALNNLLVLESSPSDIVQNPQITITAQQMQFTFQVYGMTSTATGIPAVNNGNLVVTNVTISGIASYILTPDELTTIVNRHLADAEVRINHSITAVQLKSHELDLTLGTFNNGGTKVPTKVPTAIPTSVSTLIPTGIPTALPTNLP
jgi:hypothetical protein